MSRLRGLKNKHTCWPKKEEIVKPVTIRCNAVSYRQGFIEITPGIHDGCVNIECWDVFSGHDISQIVNFRNCDLPYDAFQGSSELELDLPTAEALVEAIRAAILVVRNAPAAHNDVVQ